MIPREASSVELQALLDAAVDAILIIDQFGRVETFNSSAERLFGYTGLEVLGQNVSMLMTDTDRCQHDAYLERYRATGVPRIIGIGREVTARRKDGSVFLAHLSVGEIAGARPPRYVGFIRDLTLQQQAFDAVKRERERMMHVSRLATVGEMAAGISHELNQPLAAVTTYAQAARRLLATTRDPPEDVIEALEQIAAQALRAGEIIRRLRNLVRNDATQREPTDLNELIVDLGTLTRADARLNDVRINLQLAPALPWCELDSIQIQQVLLNLVRNAVQALETVPREEREIVISTGLSGDGAVEVCVRDAGLGVAASMLDKIFQPFATSKAEGTGLGLAISRSIVEAHKGTLSYVPNTPRGACFICRLPVTQRTDS
jgi:two-component system, LuxR family, sensor kinase FixL